MAGDPAARYPRSEPGRNPARSHSCPSTATSGRSAGVAGRHPGARSARNRTTVNGCAGSGHSPTTAHQASNRAHSCS
jgi:hypothetical protein